MTDKDPEGLWQRIADGIAPLKGRVRKARSKATVKPILLRETITVTPPIPQSRSKGAGIDRNTRQAFERGEMPIDAHLDLHGRTQDQALAALHAFIYNQAQAGSRCVIVVTGKGTAKDRAQSADWWDSPRGVLRQRFHDWIALPALKPLILHVVPARPKHGGSGAFYVLLRRMRV